MEYIHLPVSSSVSGNVMAGAGTLRMRTRLERIHYRFDLTKLDRIMAQDFDNSQPYGRCTRMLPGKIVTLFDKAGFPGFHTVRFHVASQDVEPLLAAPNAELVGKLSK